MTEEQETEERCRRALERIAALDMGPDEALIMIRSFFGPGERDGIEQLYQALRTAMWHLMSSRTYGVEMNRWHSILRQIAAWYSPGSGIYEKIHVLADLALASGHFGVLLDQARESEQSKHVTDILLAVTSANGTANLTHIHNVTGITTNILLLMANTMAAQGLVTRRGYGSRTTLSIP